MFTVNKCTEELQWSTVLRLMYCEFGVTETLHWCIFHQPIDRTERNQVQAGTRAGGFRAQRLW